MTTKSIEEWERERGLVIRDVEDPSAAISEDEFNTLANRPDNTYINHEDREKFLTDNGFEITRENLVNQDLHPKVEEETNKEEV